MQVQNSNDSNSHTLPLARIKKIMKSDEEVRRVQEYITLDRSLYPSSVWGGQRGEIGEAARGGEGRAYGACKRPHHCPPLTHSLTLSTLTSLLLSRNGLTYPTANHRTHKQTRRECEPSTLFHLCTSHLDTRYAHLKPGFEATSFFWRAAAKGCCCYLGIWERGGGGSC